MTHLQSRSILDQSLTKLQEDIIRLTSMVDSAIENSMTALETRNVILAQEVVAGDEAINVLRFEIEKEALTTLATQQPIAIDLRKIIVGIHITVELERIGDHASGIASLVTRMEGEDDIKTLYKLPKMASRARKMIQQGIQAYVDNDSDMAQAVFQRDEKLDKHYNNLVQLLLDAMQNDDYIRRATFLSWIGHNLERIGDRATNIAERVVFMATGEFVEFIDDLES
jgi:phosphate transport system protein